MRSYILYAIAIIANIWTTVNVINTLIIWRKMGKMAKEDSLYNPNYLTLTGAQPPNDPALAPIENTLRQPINQRTLAKLKADLRALYLDIEWRGGLAHATEIELLNILKMRDAIRQCEAVMKLQNTPATIDDICKYDDDNTEIALKEWTDKETGRIYRYNEKLGRWEDANE